MHWSIVLPTNTIKSNSTKVQKTSMPETIEATKEGGRDSSVHIKEATFKVKLLNANIPFLVSVASTLPLSSRIMTLTTTAFCAKKIAPSMLILNNNASGGDQETKGNTNGLEPENVAALYSSKSCDAHCTKAIQLFFIPHV